MYYGSGNYEAMILPLENYLKPKDVQFRYRTMVTIWMTEPWFSLPRVLIRLTLALGIMRHRRRFTRK